MTKIITIITLWMFLPYTETSAQSIFGKYSQCAPTGREYKINFKSYLELFDNGEFEYSIYGDTGPLKIGRGVWKMVESKIRLTLQRRQQDSLRIVGITMKYILKSDNKRRVEMYYVEEDTMRMVGTYLITGRDTLVLGVNKPIEILMSARNISFVLLDEKTQFHFEENNKFNHFIFYLTGQKDQIADVDQLPFSDLSIHEGKLVSSSFCFKRVN